MFRIYLSLPYFKYSGLKALDFLRKVGLPDGAYVYSASKETCRYSEEASVDEEFARLYFDDQEAVCMQATVDLSYLTEGDLVVDETNGYVKFNPAMCPDRVKQLWFHAPVPVETE